MADFPEKAVPLLGKIPDTHIAKRFSVPLHRVRYARHSRGIDPAVRKGRPSKRTPELRAALGTDTDAAVGAKFGVSGSMVCAWRRELDIPAYSNQGRPSIEYTQEGRKAFLEEGYPGLYQKLGRFTDSSLADEYGISRERIRQFRGFFDIPSYQEQTEENFEEIVVPLMGTMTDTKLGRMFGVHENKIGKERRARGIPAFGINYEDLMEANRHRMGKESDHQIARDLGVNPRTVTRWRNKFEIDPIHPSPRSGANKIPRDEIKRLFRQGKSDDEIASALGSTPATIGSIRRELNLFRRRPSGKPYATGPRPKARSIDYGKVRILFEEGWTDVAIADALQTSAGAIRHTRNKLGLVRT